MYMKNSGESKITIDHGKAPYNFISLPEKSVSEYSSVEELPKHDEMQEELLNGIIEYDITALTPLLIGGGNTEKDDKRVKNMFKNPDGKYVIPGNTIRGFLRNNAAILSMSNISDDIANERFYFRSFGKDVAKCEYSQRMRINQKKDKVSNKVYSVAQTVKAGYLYKKSNSEYVLVPAKKLNDRQYYRVGEEQLRMICKNVELQYMYSEKIKELITEKAKFQSADQKERKKKIREFLKIQHNQRYTTNGPVEVSFDVSGKDTVQKIDKPAVLTHKGWVMSSKYVSGKRAHYVINEPDWGSADEIKLDNNNNNMEFIKFYEGDLLRTEKVEDVKKDENYYTLPHKIGEKNGKPIFYGEFQNKVYFGFTPYFRIPYDYSVYQGINPQYRENCGISYCDSMFGFCNKKFGELDRISYKTRISVEDAVCCGKVNIKSNIEQKRYYNVILGKPKASSYPNYLEQSSMEPKKLNSYNSPEFKIRGIKQYWQKDYIDDCSLGTNDEVVSELHPLESGSKFKGRVYFKNLKQEELGLLLWALKVDELATENMGMGKPYGFGRVNIDNIAVKLENLNNKYSKMSYDYCFEERSEKYIEIYRRDFQKKYNIKIEEQKGVKELIRMKTTVVNKIKKAEAKYMPLQDFKDHIPLLDLECQVKEFEKKFNKK